MKFSMALALATSIVATAALADTATIDAVAATLFAEARGEGEEGMRLVASVIWNRACGDRGRFYAVVTKPKQFSCWNGGKTPTVSPKESEKAIYETAKAISKEMWDGNFKPSTEATHFCVTRLNPSWSKKMKLVKTYKNHKFFV